MAGDDPKNGSKNDDTSFNVNSPFYIHPSDYPKQMHVNEVLTDCNYGDWAQEMKNFLFAKNKMGLIDGSVKKPGEGSSDYSMWMRCDAMIKGWLSTAMEKDIRMSVKYANTAAEIWADLEERFGKESAPRAYELKQSLTHTRQDGASISAYYTKLRALWDEIQSVSPLPRCNCGNCTCGVGRKLTESRDKEKLYEFLMGLDDVFPTVKTHILTIKPAPSLCMAYHLVAEDEQQRNISSTKRPTNETTAFQTSTFNKRETNTYPNVQRNLTSQRDTRRGNNEELEHCTFCGKDGHNINGCFKKIGYPDWWPSKSKREKGRPKAAAYVETEMSPIPGLTVEQYMNLVKHFSNEASTPSDSATPSVNMAGLTIEEPDWNG